jgi:hypothetical protein
MSLMKIFFEKINFAEKFTPRYQIKIKRGEYSLIDLKSEKIVTRKTKLLSHPRILVSDFILMEKEIQSGIVELVNGGKIFMSGIAYIQIVEELDGGMTNVEKRMYEELLLGAGSREVIFISGTRNYSRNNLLSGNFKILD